MAKTLGQPEQYIKDNYSFTEILERNLFDVYDNYIGRKLTEIKK
jgi:hypothetical protein